MHLIKSRLGVDRKVRHFCMTVLRRFTSCDGLKGVEMWDTE